jgi:hypothetical protein
MAEAHDAVLGDYLDKLKAGADVIPIRRGTDLSPHNVKNAGHLSVKMTGKCSYTFAA